MVFASRLGEWPTSTAPPLLLIVRERVRPGCLVAYDRIETEIRRQCVLWGCPNAYLGLTSASSAAEVWWLTAWSSQEELDRASGLHAANTGLAARLAPLNARKRALTDEPTTILARAADQSPLALAGARFVTVISAGRQGRIVGAAYDLPDGRRVGISLSASRPARLPPDGLLLAMQPRWSLPPAAFASADPTFWNV